MKKKMLIPFALILVCVLVAFCSSSNAQTQQQPTVTISQQTADACNQAFDEVKASRAAIDALKIENAARQQKDFIQQGIITQQEKLIELLQKQNRKKIKFLYGLISITF